MDKQNTRVNMSLEDYEGLEYYKRGFNKLLKDIKNIAYIDSITSEEAIIKVKYDQFINFLINHISKDCELEHLENNQITVIWKKTE